MKNLILITLLLLPGMRLLAQDDMGEKNDRIESYRIAFITERLNLSAKEATSFWPIFNEYSQQIKSIRSKDRERTRIFLDKTDPSTEESEKFIAEHISFKQQELELTRKYLSEFRKVLSPPKVARLITLDQEFKMQLLQQMKGREGKRIQGFKG